MYLLDTDHVTLLERGGTEGIAIRERLRQIGCDDIATSIIGWLAFIAQFRDIEEQREPYRRLETNLRFYRNILTLPFDEQAVAMYQALQQAKVKIGTMDLKIASVALANDATLLARNLRNFEKVPGLHIEDWTQ